MLIDKLVEQIKRKKNPCIVGLDPEWEKLPDCYKSNGVSRPEAILQWAKDVIDTVVGLEESKPAIFFCLRTTGKGCHCEKRYAILNITSL